MKVYISNREGLKAIYPYKDKDKMPAFKAVTYPCAASFESADAGICGEGKQLEWIPIPITVTDVVTFIEGINAAARVKTSGVF